ncbi:MAG TPA: DUF4864 domain-containing protein [Stellaceae bacterium]|nr:DUF4864 domain-containing protein [Stellaceae bacterium]
MAPRAKSRLTAWALVLVTGLAIGLSSMVLADEVPSTLGSDDRSAIRKVIDDQEAAFRRDDGPSAFALAAPGIRAMFGDPETFMNMVKSGYQPVYRPKEFQYQSLREIDGKQVQRVRVVGPDGRARIAAYIMERQGDGSWRIGGCILLDAEEEGV